jgi:hypothetical protein
MDDKQILSLCNLIRQTSFDLHSYLKHGHLEKVYENGLSHIAQLLGYLRASRIKHGLLINFGTPKIEIRKFIL